MVLQALPTDRELSAAEIGCYATVGMSGPIFVIALAFDGVRGPIGNTARLLSK